jgi:hypothetical protein
MAGPKTVSTDHGQATGVFIDCLDELTGTFHREK